MLKPHLVIPLVLSLAAACRTLTLHEAFTGLGGPDDEGLAGAKIQLEGTIAEGGGPGGEPLVLATVVRVAPDGSAIEFDLTGETYSLAWDGKDDPTCSCRTYADDEFKAVVVFPRNGRRGQAKVDRLGGHRAG